MESTGKMIIEEYVFTVDYNGKSAFMVFRCQFFWLSSTVLLGTSSNPGSNSYEVYFL